MGERKFSSVQSLSHVQLFATPWATTGKNTAKWESGSLYSSLSLNGDRFDDLIKPLCFSGSQFLQLQNEWRFCMFPTLTFPGKMKCACVCVCVCVCVCIQNTELILSRRTKNFPLLS